ncbi:hypothetical protein [Oceanobacillus sp. CF4.6]|uniref:hypothetical protein n=1 Tax=Oceanobacillus sp. CF4.6 TaxID=3373080 RepID=UPI003EE65AD1
MGKLTLKNTAYLQISFTLKQQIYNKENDLISEGIMKHVMFNMKDRKSIPVVLEIRSAFENVKEDTK